jgi:putative ABC transport system permease protein
LRDAVSGSPDITAAMLLGNIEGRIGDKTVQLVMFDPVQGGLLPRVRSGRVPMSSDEIALGELEADNLGVKIGDDISFAAGAGEATYHVVGRVLVPNLGVNAGVGRGGVLTTAAARRVEPTAEASIAAVTIRDHAPGGVAGVNGRLSAASGTIVQERRLPAGIRNVQRIDAMPWVLAVLLAALALVTFGSAIHSSLSTSRREIAILRALGAEHRFTRRVQRWQITWLTLFPVIAGLLLGVLVGGIVFRAFASPLGAVPDPALPIMLLGLLAVALFVAASLVSMVPARAIRRMSVYEALRAP